MNLARMEENEEEEEREREREEGERVPREGVEPNDYRVPPPHGPAPQVPPCTL